LTLEDFARTFDACALDGAASAAMLDRLGVIRRLVDGLVAKSANRAHETAAFLESGDRDTVHFVARTVGVSAGEARAAIATASELDALPAVDAAVREGRLSARQTERIATTATAHPGCEKRLLAAAKIGDKALKDACQRVRAEREDPAERSKRQHRSRTLRTWTDDDGMLNGAFSLTPETGGQLKAIIDREAQKRFRASDDHEPLHAHAADVLTEQFLGDSAATGVKTTVHVVVDHAALTRGNTVEGERCEIPGVGPVNVEWARSLLGDAFVTAVITKGRDITTVAHLGRHVPAEVRTAMLVAGRECDVEGCECRDYLELDHSEIDFAAGGPTAFWNLTWLCWKHHRRKSSGWALGPRNPHTDKRPLQPPSNQTNAA
jgi:hypothetical protein